MYSEVDENNKPSAKIAVITSDRWYPITSAKDPSEIIANAIVHSYQLKDDNYINRIVIYCNPTNILLAVGSLLPSCHLRRIAYPLVLFVLYRLFLLRFSLQFL